MNKKLLILGLLIIFFFGVFFYIIFFAQTKSPSTTLPFPTPTVVPLNRTISESYTFSPFQKTSIGKTTKEEVEKLSVVREEAVDSNTTKYIVSSVDPEIFDEILIEENVVVFEKTSTFTDAQGGFPKISEFLKAFGRPEEEVTGSKTHGAFATLYLYPRYGFIFIGNKATDRVYEIQRFTAMTMEEFKNKYGTEIKTEWDHEE